jgi:integrase
MGAEKIVRLETGIVYKQIELFLKKKSYKSENTSNSYLRDIQKFFRTVRDKELQFLTVEDVNINLDIMEEYIATLVDQGTLNNKSINRNIVSVKELMRYLKQKKLVNDIEYINHLDRLPEVENKIGILTVSEALQLAELATEERNLGTIKHYLILFALDTGIRRSAILDLRWSDFEEVENDGHVIIRGVDKGNKSFKKSISTSFYNQLKANLKTSDDTNEKVFKISKDAIDSMLNRLTEKMSIDPSRRISFHSLRKCAVTFAYRLTNDILEAKRVAGHSNINNTLLYVEEMEFGAIGAVSSSQSLDMKLFEKVDHETLLAAIRELKSDTKLLLNLKLQEKIK